MSSIKKGEKKSEKNNPESKILKEKIQRRLRMGKEASQQKKEFHQISLQVR